MKDKILMGVSALFGLMMLVFGLNKFLQFMPMPEMPGAAGELMGAFVSSGWLFPLIALAEIVGGLLLILPKTRALGAIVILPVIVGIVLFHVVMEPSGMPMAIVLFAINGWIIFENKDRYMHMIR